MKLIENVIILRSITNTGTYFLLHR